MTPTKLTADISDQFLADADAMCAPDACDCDVEQFLGVSESESQISARAHNPGGATGLVQFDNWDKHGLLVLPSGRHLTWEAVQQMSDDDQLIEVRNFLLPFRGHLTHPGQLYTACFLPVAAYSGHYGPGFVVCGSRPGDPFQSAYRDNPGFDTARKGYITADDMAARTQHCIGTPRVQECLARLRDIRAAFAGPPTPPSAA